MPEALTIHRAVGKKMEIVSIFIIISIPFVMIFFVLFSIEPQNEKNIKKEIIIISKKYNLKKEIIYKKIKKKEKESDSLFKILREVNILEYLLK